MKGVIPAAGLGTRLLPATKAQPKEMLPLVDKPSIQYVVEEAGKAGLSEVVIVVAPRKASIVDHFAEDRDQLERLERAGRLGELQSTLDLIRSIKITFVTQEQPLGLGHAVLQAEPKVGEETFAVLLGDDIILSKTPCIGDLMDAHARTRTSVIGVQKVPREDLPKYGVVDPATKSGRLRPLRGVVEKPSSREAPSDFAIMGRYVFTRGIFDSLRRTKPGRNNEIQLTDAIRDLITKEPVSMLHVRGERLDVGGKLDWLKANVRLGLLDPSLRRPLRRFLRGLV